MAHPNAMPKTCIAFMLPHRAPKIAFTRILARSCRSLVTGCRGCWSVPLRLRSPRRLANASMVWRFLVASLTSTLLLNVAVTRGATLTVFNSADGGPGTLRQTIFDASSGDTINFATGVSQVSLTSDELLINKNLTIDGPGADRLIIYGSNFRIFHVAPASVAATISGLKMQSGRAPVNEDGGGILNIGTLTINSCTILNSSSNNIGGNSGGNGGGVANTGTLTITNSTISSNRSYQSNNSSSGGQSNGGGIANTGTLTITNSTISGNQSSQSAYNGVGNQSSSGGGIANFGGATLTITNSTISGNQSSQRTSYPGGSRSSSGGGIANFGGAMLTVTNSTISGNQSNENSPDGGQSNGGGIATFGGATLIITNSTVSGNNTAVLATPTPSPTPTATATPGNLAACGGGIFTDGSSSTTARSTIIALNNGLSGPDICGALTSQGFNLVGNISGATIAPQLSDQIGTSGAPIDPLLGPLQYNGGPTFTRALQSNSPAVNRGDSNAPARDQRGYVRAGVSDTGAFEFSGTVPVSLANISTRLRVETGDNVLIGGFILTGLYPKKVIVRAIGPSLSSFFPDALANPSLELRNSSGALLASNDNWRADQEAEINATGIPPSNDLESAIVATLPANNAGYTAIVRGVNNGTGIGVVEVYDLNRTVDSKLENISTRGLVQTGNNVLIAGTIVVGQDSQKVLLRGIGPSLNIAGKLADPILELRDGNGALIRANDNWRTDQQAEIIATTIQGRVGSKHLTF